MAGEKKLLGVVSGRTGWANSIASSIDKRVEVQVFSHKQALDDNLDLKSLDALLIDSNDSIAVFDVAHILRKSGRLRAIVPIGIVSPLQHDRELLDFLRARGIEIYIPPTAGTIDVARLVESLAFKFARRRQRFEVNFYSELVVNDKKISGTVTDLSTNGVGFIGSAGGGGPEKGVECRLLVYPQTSQTSDMYSLGMSMGSVNRYSGESMGLSSMLGSPDGAGDDSAAVELEGIVRRVVTKRQRLRRRLIVGIELSEGSANDAKGLLRREGFLVSE